MTLPHSHNDLCECEARNASAMATNLDVDIAAIEELMRLGRFRSKREAVDASVQEAIAYRKQLKAIDFLGTIDFQQGGAVQPASGET